MTEPRKLLIAGDVHGNRTHLRYLFEMAVKEECDGIIQLGDFGFWTHTKRGSEYLTLCRDLIDKHGIFLWWLDGNHENFDNLYELYPLDSHGVRPMFPGHHWTKEFPVHDPFVHLPRGYTWAWHGLRFCAFGGAFSIDKNHRLFLEGHSKSRSYWWPQEQITEADLIRFTTHVTDPVDVFFAHDCPEGVDIPSLRDWPDGMFPDADANRTALKIAVDHVRPKVLIHGHHHDLYEGTYEGPDFVTRVCGLNCDGTDAASWRTLTIA